MQITNNELAMLSAKICLIGFHGFAVKIEKHLHGRDPSVNKNTYCRLRYKAF
jgi:hypothetical protein